MDRRRFLQTVLSSTLAVPLAAGLKPATAASPGGELFIISDTPQDVLPSLLAGLSGQGLVPGRLFSLAASDPLTAAVGAALEKDGWRRSGPGRRSDLVLSSSLLRQAGTPSFTFVRDGRVVDIRRGALLSLWRDMAKPGARSTTLTLAALGPRAAAAGTRGEKALLYLDGKKKDRLDLRRDAVRTYETAGGFVRVAVEAGAVRVAEASCAHKICASSAPVSGAGERIVCAPNRFLVRVEGRRAVDAVIG
jgi:hypothetical protein